MMMAGVRVFIRFLDPSYLGSGCKRMYPKPTRTRPAFADDGRTRITPALAAVINGNNNNNNGVSTCTTQEPT